MSFQEAVTTVLTKKYADFSGRARRSEYWWFALAAFLLLAVPYVLGLAVSKVFLVLFFVAWLGLLVPSIAVTVRRLHDTGKSGWFYLVAFIPFVGGIILLVFTVMDSTPGDNQYGPNPKGGVSPYAAA